MRKRGLVVLMLACLAVTGCRKAIDVDSIEHNNDTASTDYDDTYVEPEEDYIEEEEYEKEEEEIPDSPAEVEGIVGMVRQDNTFDSTIQIVAINPETGVQNIINEFYLEYPHHTDEIGFLPPADSIFGNDSNMFSEDYTKLAITQYYVQGVEAHAGWVDNTGEFFDVTEAIGAVTEKDFSNPDPVQQYGIGFSGDSFVFSNSRDVNRPETKFFCVPVDNISEELVTEITKDDVFPSYYEIGSNPEVCLTDWLDETTFIADSFGMSNGWFLDSVLMRIDDTENPVAYIPESERYNWSGVLNVDKTTVAFLSMPKSTGSTAELYTVPVAGGDPVSISLVPNDGLMKEITSLTTKNLENVIKDIEKEHIYYYLLDWR